MHNEKIRATLLYEILIAGQAVIYDGLIFPVHCVVMKKCFRSADMCLQRLSIANYAGGS